MSAPLYTAKVTSSNGRDGQAQSSDRRLKVDLSSPTNPNRPATGTDPEQLFAAGYSACFASAIAFVAKQKGIERHGQIGAEATVNLLKRDAGGFTLSVALDFTIPGVDDATAAMLAKEADGVCPYSNATRGNIEVAITARGA